jgi:hypothetical protein
MNNSGGGPSHAEIAIDPAILGEDSSAAIQQVCVTNATLAARMIMFGLQFIVCELQRMSDASWTEFYSLPTHRTKRM